MFDLIESCYQRGADNYRGTFKVGQFYWMPVGYLLERKAQRLRIDCGVGNNVNYTLENCDLRNLDLRRDRDNYALKSSEEFYLTITHKFRPVVVLSRVQPEWVDSGLHYTSCFVVAPAYSVKDRMGRYKFGEEFIQRVQAYEFPSLFYLPEEEKLGVREAILRFDRALIANREVLQARSNVYMTDEYVYCMTHWLCYYLDGPLDEFLQEYREHMLNEISKKRS